MFLKRTKNFFVVVIAFLLFFPPMTVIAEEEPFSLTLMHMNDTHARVDKFPKMISAIKDVRASEPEALLFHAGDVFSGTLYFTEFKGEADLALMNLMSSMRWFTATTSLI